MGGVVVQNDADENRLVEKNIKRVEKGNSTF